jgi:Co/Zn/Cd efflux system component
LWKKLDLPQNLTSHHLRVLKQARLIESEKIGAKVVYKLDQARIDKNIKLEFDLSRRIVTFYHIVDGDQLLRSLKVISLPGKLLSTEEIPESKIPNITPSVEAKTLKYLLAINFTMFIVEILFGIYAQSTGLLADGLDMLADSLVYGLSLFAVGKSLTKKNQAAFLSGIMQITLGLLCIFEVARKYNYGSEPLANYMIIVSLIAFAANVLCLVLIYKHKDGEVHMKASWIFSANDVIVNMSVLISGILVYFLNSNIPDLVIGGLVAVIVIRGGVSIIKMSKNLHDVNEDKATCCSRVELVIASGRADSSWSKGKVAKVEKKTLSVAK